LLLALLLIVAVLGAPPDSSVEPVESSYPDPSTADTLCVGGQLEVRMCKVARDGFAVALDY
jgi:hypothetical protein